MDIRLFPILKLTTGTVDQPSSTNLLTGDYIGADDGDFHNAGTNRGTRTSKIVTMPPFQVPDRMFYVPRDPDFLSNTSISPPLAVPSVTSNKCG
jgi:hypothetical protein